MSPPDNMEVILRMQADLEARVPHRIKAPVVHQMTTGLGLIEETLEYLNSIGRKPWRPYPQPLEEQLEELTDILFYYAALILQSGFTWGEIVDEYERKHAINLKRYRDGAKGDYSWDKRSEKGEL